MIYYHDGYDKQIVSAHMGSNENMVPLAVTDGLLLGKHMPKYGVLKCYFDR